MNDFVLKMREKGCFLTNLSILYKNRTASENLPCGCFFVEKYDGCGFDRSVGADQMPSFALLIFSAVVKFAVGVWSFRGRIF